MDGVGDLRLATVVVNTSDMRRAVDFWCTSTSTATSSA
jgi:hypothetical protein